MMGTGAKEADSLLSARTHKRHFIMAQPLSARLRHQIASRSFIVCKLFLFSEDDHGIAVNFSRVCAFDPQAYAVFHR